MSGADQPIEKGKLYKVIHSRKGTFMAHGAEDAAGDVEWLDFVVAEGSLAGAVMRYNVAYEGDPIRVRRSHCLVYPQEEAPCPS